MTFLYGLIQFTVDLPLNSLSDKSTRPHMAGDRVIGQTHFLCNSTSVANTNVLLNGSLETKWYKDTICLLGVFVNSVYPLQLAHKSEIWHYRSRCSCFKNINPGVVVTKMSS